MYAHTKPLKTLNSVSNAALPHIYVNAWYVDIPVLIEPFINGQEYEQVPAYRYRIGNCLRNCSSLGMSLKTM